MNGVEVTYPSQWEYDSLVGTWWHIDKWRRGVVRTVASRTFFISFPLSSQRRGKFRCLPDKRPTGVGDGYHGYNSDVSPLANVDEAWRCWLPLLVDASIEDTSMDGYDGRWIHSNPPFLNLHLTWELQSEVRESRVPGPGTHLVINQKQSKRTTLQWNQHSINLSLPQLAYPYPVALVTLRKVARIECMNPHLTVLTPFEVNVEQLYCSTET